MVFCIQRLVEKVSVTNSSFQLKFTCIGLLDLFKKQKAQSPSLNGLTHISRLSFTLYLYPSIPALSWLIAITSLLVRIAFVSFDIFLKSFPAIRGAASIDHKEKCALVFIYCHTIANFKHIRIVPMTGACIFSQPILQISNGHYSQLFPGTMIQLAIKHCRNITGCTPKLTYVCCPFPGFISSPIRKG